MAARNWTPEQRQRQRDAIQRWKPWTRATGPRSTEGKARAARNAWNGGARALLRELARALRCQISGLRETVASPLVNKRMPTRVTRPSAIFSQQHWR